MKGGPLVLSSHLDALFLMASSLSRPKIKRDRCTSNSARLANDNTYRGLRDRATSFFHPARRSHAGA